MLKNHHAFRSYIYHCALINWCFESVSCQSLEADCPGSTEKENKENRQNVAELDVAWAAVDLVRVFKMLPNKVSVTVQPCSFAARDLKGRAVEPSFFHLPSAETHLTTLPLGQAAFSFFSNWQRVRREELN